MDETLKSRYPEYSASVSLKRTIIMISQNVRFDIGKRGLPLRRKPLLIPGIAEREPASLKS